MSKTREILTRINSIKSTKKITQAMKVVSASKLSKFTEKLEKLKYFLNKNEEIIEILKKNFQIKKKIQKNKKSKNILILLITSDKGLCGSFNSRIFQILEDFISKRKEISSKIDILPIGKKGLDFTKNKNFDIIDSFWKSTKKFNISKLKDLIEFILKSQEIYSDFYIIYNSLYKNEAKVEIQNIALDENSYELKTSNFDFIYEPSPLKIYEFLQSQLYQYKLYYYILNSLTAEYSSRMVAMTKATDNAEEIMKELEILYNRTRQSKITNELIEIISGAEALKR